MELKLSGATPYLNGIWDYKPLAGTAKEIVLTENLGSDEKGLIITTSLIDTSAKSNHLWQRVMIEGTAAAGVSEEYQKVYKWNSDVYNSKSSDAATLAYYLQPSAKIQSDDKKIIALAESLTTGRGDKYNAAKSICEWVSYDIWYDYDAYNHVTPRTENSALSTLADKYAVCEGYTALTVALLRASGIPAKPVSGLLLDEENPTSVQAFYDFSRRLDTNYLSELAWLTDTHVWTEAYIDGRWVIIDTTADSDSSYENGVFSAQGRKGLFFDIDLKKLSYTHRIADYPDYSLSAPNISTAADWARENINSAVTKGFVPSDIQDKYTSVITRQEFCRMAVRFVEYKTGKTIDAVLKDKGLTVNGNWFSDTTDSAILAAYALGITSGTVAPTDTAPGAFSPNGQFTREQAATMLMNTCKVIGMEVNNSSASGFADNSSISSWAIDGVDFVKANGIMNGTGNNSFSPKGTYTRQESIVTFDRIQ
jgi:hypothetical protein